MVRLTDDERAVLEKTVELTNSFCALPEEHRSDKAEFVAAIHRIQDMIMARPIRREVNG